MKFGKYSTSNHPKINFLTLCIIMVFSSIKSVSGQVEIIQTSADGSIMLLELFIIGIFVVITFLNMLNNKNMGNSIISPPFIYLYVGLLLTISSRIFILLSMMGFYQVPMMTIGIYWHFILYLSMIPFFIAIEKVNDRTKDKELKSFSGIDWIIVLSLMAVTLVLFLTPASLGKEIMMIIMGTSIPNYGGLHFMAFFLSLLLTIRTITVMNKTRETPVGAYMQTISTPFLVFIFITTLNHFTALLIESWELFTISQSGLIEQIFWLVGFTILLSGYIKLNSEIQKSSLGMKKYDPDVNQTDIVMTVMNVLNDHVGNLAWDIFNQTVDESGIQPNGINKENIDDFTTVIKTQSEELIGEFPSRYLKITIQKKVNSLYI